VFVAAVASLLVDAFDESGLRFGKWVIVVLRFDFETYFSISIACGSFAFYFYSIYTASNA